MTKNMRVVLLALSFAAMQVALGSAVSTPALAQKQKQNVDKKDPVIKPKTGTTTSAGGSTTTTGGKTTVKVNTPKPADSAKANREHACGNDQNKCYGLYVEMVNPHDARFPARIKAEKDYRDCMAKCIAAPGQRK